MTEQFKQTLFDYLTGKLDIQQGANEEIFKEINELSKDDWFSGNIMPSEYTWFEYEGLIKVLNSELIILYGGYRVNPTTGRGIITLLNNDFKPIKSFFQFENGTYLDYIMCMIQEDDGTFAMATCPDFPFDKEASFAASTKKFVMLNNFTQQINNNYVLTMNKSYDIPYKNNYVRKMYKDPNSSHYVLLNGILVENNNGTYGWRQTRIIELKVNVGSSNEWSYTDTTDDWLLGDSYVEFDSSGNSFVEIILSSLKADDNRIAMWTKGFNDSSYAFSIVHTFPYKPYIDSSHNKNQSAFLNKNEIYFVQNNQWWGVSGKKEAKYIGLYYYNIQTKDFKTIFEKYLGDYDYCLLEMIYITNNNNNIYIEYNNNITTVTSYSADYYFQRLEENVWNPIKTGEKQNFIYTRGLFVSNNYNILNIFSYMEFPRQEYWNMINIKENYSESKYNGQPYINTNAMIADNAEIYSNGSLVFARNLYNKSLNNNTTVATVEVPNNYLNDIDITSKNLLSETNLDIIEDTNMTQKNIYETLYINFINTLLIADRNNDTQVLNQQASTYLNNQINDDTGYSKAQIYPKVVITYQDNSTKEIAFEYQNIEDTSADIVFALYIDHPMQSAEIVSNDKSMIYQTINLTNLEQEKYYVIRQNLKII